MHQYPHIIKRETLSSFSRSFAACVCVLMVSFLVAFGMNQLRSSTRWQKWKTRWHARRQERRRFALATGSHPGQPRDQPRGQRNRPRPRGRIDLLRLLRQQSCADRSRSTRWATPCMPGTMGLRALPAGATKARSFCIKIEFEPWFKETAQSGCLGRPGLRLRLPAVAPFTRCGRRAPGSLKLESRVLFTCFWSYFRARAGRAVTVDAQDATEMGVIATGRQAWSAPPSPPPPRPPMQTPHAD